MQRSTHNTQGSTLNGGGGADLKRMRGLIWKIGFCVMRREWFGWLRRFPAVEQAIMWEDNFCEPGQRLCRITAKPRPRSRRRTFCTRCEFA